jgi:hypothetical protein
VAKCTGPAEVTERDVDQREESLSEWWTRVIRHSPGRCGRPATWRTTFGPRCDAHAELLRKAMADPNTMMSIIAGRPRTAAEIADLIVPIMCFVIGLALFGAPFIGITCGCSLSSWCANEDCADHDAGKDASGDTSQAVCDGNCCRESVDDVVCAPVAVLGVPRPYAWTCSPPAVAGRDGLTMGDRLLQGICAIPADTGAKLYCCAGDR